MRSGTNRASCARLCGNQSGMRPTLGILGARGSELLVARLPTRGAPRTRSTCMSGPHVDALRIRDHVRRLGEKHPPIPLAGADFRMLDPRRVRERFAGPLDYMARVEME